MAGGKETPRQKMIGMMYLVLTALLALQVSNQILQKFVLLNDGLERTSKNYIEKNAFMVNSIEGTVEQQGNNERDVPKVEAAKEIRRATADVFGYLEGLKQELIEQTNAKNEDGTYKTSSLKNQDITGNIFNNNRKGYEMEERLNAFPDHISSILDGVGLDLTFERIAKDAREIDLFKNDPNANYKDFVNLNFVKSPVGAVLALISQYQNEVLNIESEALSEITNSIGTFYFKSDVFEGRVAASSNVVAAGTKFEADMFIASSSSSAMPKMRVDGKELPVENGFGRISFTVPPASSYDDRGLAQKTLKGEIVVNIAGKDSVLNVNYDYFVAKPVIRVESETVNQLYANSANVLMIDVPALGTSYAPDFNVSNGRVIKGNRPGQITVIPTSESGKVTIGVSSGGNKIGDVEYDIKPVPAPTIRAYDGKGPIDLTTPYQSPGPGTLLVKAMPEANFGRTMPDDANFEVTAGEVILVRNDVPRETIQINGESIGAINTLRQRAAPGDRFVIVVKEVTRTNFQGNKIKSQVNEVYNISIK